MAVFENHLLLHIESNSLRLSNILFWNEKNNLKVKIKKDLKLVNFFLESTSI